MKLAVYLINLDGSDERLATISAALAKHNIAFERVSAIDGRKYDVQSLDFYQEQKALSYMGRQLTGGEIGCYLSHLECTKRFLTSDNDALVVMEDDLHTELNFLSIIESALIWLTQHRPDWEVINFGNPKMKIATPLHRIDAQDLTFTLCHAHYFPMMATGLVWSRQGAQEFVNASNKIFAPVDNFLRYWQTRANRGYCFWPPLVNTTGADSQIDGNTLRKKNQRASHYFWTRQSRLWQDKALALKHKLLPTHPN